MAKETTINFVEGDDFALVWTNVRPHITALSKKIKPRESGINYDGRWAEFIVPVDLFRPAGIVGSKRNLSDEQREARAERMRNLHKKEK